MILILFTFISLSFSFKTEIQGNCGTNCQWLFTEETNTLQITGTESMTTFNTIEEVPWNTYRDQIITVTIEDTITSISNFAFSNCTLLSSITLPSSLITIETYAFYNCISLGKLTFPDSLRSINKYAFAHSSIEIENQFTNIT